MKDAILDAAIKVFAAVGYEGASFSQITDRCGAKRSLILYHYSSKEELWECAIDKVKSLFMSRLDEQLARESPGSDPEKLHHLLCAFMRTSREVPEYGHFILREGLSSSPRSEWISEQLTPLSVSPGYFDNPTYYETALTGMMRQVIAGAVLYVTNMGPLMELDKAVDDGTNPLSEENTQEVARIIVETVALLFGKSEFNG
ncbi:MAG: TetR/AcrR family transcriptional regulator [Gammaproteobacteria bacterium]|nr:TetR/AcrR family transcriptional regulator [Gammaproteobacteria bacterium]